MIFNKKCPLKMLLLPQFLIYWSKNFRVGLEERRHTNVNIVTNLVTMFTLVCLLSSVNPCMYFKMTCSCKSLDTLTTYICFLPSMIFYMYVQMTIILKNVCHNGYIEMIFPLYVLSCGISSINFLKISFRNNCICIEFPQCESLHGF